MSVWEKWRPWLQREKQLLLELALMLLVALVVGVYFLEHFSARLQAEQRVQLKALAQQTALRSAESLAGDDLIGLNVIARETRALEPVGGVQFLDVAREPVTGKSDDSLPDPRCQAAAWFSAAAEYVDVDDPYGDGPTPDYTERSGRLSARASSAVNCRSAEGRVGFN